MASKYSNRKKAGTLSLCSISEFKSKLESEEDIEAYMDGSLVFSLGEIE